MKITPYGAAGEVTGSCYHVVTQKSEVLVDCGLFQSGEDFHEKNVIPDAISVRKLDAVLITHAHLDHVGRLPLLIKHGYKGPIYGTPATLDLIELVLKDAAKVQAQDTQRLNRKLERAGKPTVAPLYEQSEVEAVCRLLKPLAYRHPVKIAHDITLTLREAGHMLGSASIDLRADGKTVIFSGDIGPRGLPILKDPEPFECADAAFMESTYGDRDHKPMSATLDEFYQIITTTVDRGGKVLIPSFAIGRTQQMLYHLAELMQKGGIRKVPIFVDSPMAIRATHIYDQHTDLFDEDAQKMIDAGTLDALLRHVHFTETPAESMSINQVEGAAIIIAGAGMCNAGRILHHMKYHLWKPETAMIIVGYQVAGSLGRRLVDGAKLVRILGDEIIVRASVHTLGGFSAHAGQSELIAWFRKLLPCNPRAILVHGEDRAREPLAALLKQVGAPKVDLPRWGEVLEIG